MYWAGRARITMAEVDLRSTVHSSFGVIVTVGKMFMSEGGQTEAVCRPV